MRRRNDEDEKKDGRCPFTPPLVEENIVAIFLNMYGISQTGIPPTNQFEDDQTRTSARNLSDRAAHESSEQPRPPSTGSSSLARASFPRFLIGVVVKLQHLLPRRVETRLMVEVLEPAQVETLDDAQGVLDSLLRDRGHQPSHHEKARFQGIMWLDQGDPALAGFEGGKPV